MFTQTHIVGGFTFSLCKIYPIGLIKLNSSTLTPPPPTQAQLLHPLNTTSRSSSTPPTPSHHHPLLKLNSSHTLTLPASLPHTPSSSSFTHNHLSQVVHLLLLHRSQRTLIYQLHRSNMTWKRCVSWS